MPTNTYVALDKVTVSGSSTTTVSFTSISQSYTDLVFIVNGSKSGSSSTDIAWQANSDTNSNYSQTSIYGTGSAAASDRGVSATSARNGRLGIDQSTSILNFQNYSNTTTFKTCISRGNTAGYLVIANVGLWRSTSAISSLVFTLADGTNFVSGTTFSLYGILKEGSGDSTPKAVGGVVTSDATYYYHTFATSSNFIPNQTVTCDYLIVGGGGGGGPIIGGGGGAGGYRPFSSASITAGTYPVVIGAGGNGGAYGGIGGTLKAAGTAGNASTFNGNSAAGGGRGAYFADGSFFGPATSGGSGGGGSRDQAAGAGNTPSTSPVQGYAGGTGQGGAPYYNAAGGGGAGGVGSNAGTNSGNGGPGLNWQSLGTYYAGGGGGAPGDQGGPGTGGIGGGGDGVAGVGLPGGYATGGGGGGGHSTGGAGGGGVVIIRYVKA